MADLLPARRVSALNKALFAEIGVAREDNERRRFSDIESGGVVTRNGSDDNRLGRAICARDRHPADYFRAIGSFIPETYPWVKLFDRHARCRCERPQTAAFVVRKSPPSQSYRLQRFLRGQLSRVVGVLAHILSQRGLF